MALSLKNIFRFVLIFCFSTTIQVSSFFIPPALQLGNFFPSSSFSQYCQSHPSSSTSLLVKKTHFQPTSSSNSKNTPTPPTRERITKTLKPNTLELEGKIDSALPNAVFRVLVPSLGAESLILCVISGKIRKNFVKILVGDSVTVEVSDNDLTKGRITFRRRV